MLTSWKTGSKHMGGTEDIVLDQREDQWSKKCFNLKISLNVPFLKNKCESTDTDSVHTSTGQ